MGAEALAEVRNLVEGVRPLDGLEEEHRSQVLCWLSRTDDVFRRVKPRTPDQHLVSYFLVVDPQGPYVLLGDHIKAGRWLPTGGHVEPDESPVDTVRREVWEELGIQARFPAWIGERPLLLTVTETVGAVHERHTDVSLWFVLEGSRHQQLTPDASEFHKARWWRVDGLSGCEPARFDPHLGRMLEKLARSLPLPDTAT
jgi:8-oxo-dGTP pyrophosphatase MutT (NUDIX family)